MIDSIIIQKLLVVTKFARYLNLLEWNWVKICTICCDPFVIFLVTVIVIQRSFSISKSANLWNVFCLRKCFFLSESSLTFFTLKELLANILIVEVPT